VASASLTAKARTGGERARSRLLQRGLLRPRRQDGELILLYNTMFGDSPRLPERPPGDLRFTTDLRAFSAARLVVFHIPSLGRIDRLPKPDGQLWVAWWMECEHHFERLADPEFMGRFDLTMSHRLDADVRVPYLGGVTAEELRSHPRPKRELAALFISARHETSGRTGYAAELMRHLDVHSYGTVLRNRRLDEDRGRQSKLDAIGSYRFTLALENAIADDYVTEKLYDPLVAGSVPVYLGAPNVAQLAPSPGSFIDVRDFPDPAALAKYLLELADDDEAYERHLEWKREPFDAAFEELLSEQRTDPFARLCELVAARR
jgi:hypothetical protein